MTYARWLHAVGGSALLMIALVGCAASPSAEPEPTPAPPVVDTPDDTPPNPDDTPTPDTPTPRSADAVAYVPWGPDDPVIPQHYGELARRDCSAAQSSSPAGEFWDAVLAVCRTLTQGEPWPDLTEAPAPPQTDNPHEQCLDTELAEMVSAALAWRSENADALPDVTYADSGSPCYLRVYDSRQVPPEEDSTGPAPGQITVAVVLDSTYDLGGVTVDGTALDSGDYVDAGNDPAPGTRTVSVHLPAPESATQVTVDLALTQGDTYRGIATATVEVTSASEATSSESSDDGSSDDGSSDDGSSDDGSSDDDASQDDDSSDSAQTDQ